ncbi:molybdate ABC transporter periplasmic molybdate-binding protein [Sphingobacterium mizutaii]|mgnify:FL=1|uniref:Molybdate ABC transporter periplasmic molybdate-binding protein n=2 Tax=Sphingobacterium mizutaii TaxID=1010 RepID=A0AAJ4XG66_9SPHI|nr:substrate-binding domain-containing protein [Sphingobacterium mizutaii]SDL80326.1 ABC-type molybdate transport system, substrate-binding protein [Sphingobacterium mizutaii]SNV59266.1 molybdate ABC transporter periplasmic molybdate-binding protein [Sphingobacterium mizutaii]
MKNLKRILLLAVILLMNKAFAQDPFQYDPPWNTAPKSAVNFTVPGIDNVPDLFGDIVDPQLVVFFAGNQFMVMDDLLAAFKQKHPKYERIFVETLPPGILAKQIEGGSITIGNMRITHKPDVYAAGKNRIDSMQNHFSRTEVYAYNKLAIMVPQGNPKAVKTVQDLAKKDVKIAMPNPAWEGIGRQIVSVYKKLGGEQLEKTIMKDKVSDGSTYKTKIHHRESPMKILYKEVDAAPVWYSEVVYQKLLNHPVEMVEIPNEQNIKATYMIAEMKNAPRAQAAKDFVDFMKSDEAKAIYKKYGFETP